MVNHTDANVVRDFDAHKEKQNSPASDQLSAAVSGLNRSRDSFGDLIRSLSDSYENRRAMQTSEWETLRRQSLRRAS